MRKVLIADDEKEIVSFLERGIKREGFDVSIAYNGRQAIEVIEKNEPDIIILDIMMPEIDGLGVLKWIKENKKNIYVILASARKEVQDMSKGYSMEADYYITKPYELSEILKGMNLLFAMEKEN
ncbi:MAG: response regulator [Candidatus Omnitrophica bacterium]|jgi:DNA-binding response OmpR family regulator|nr:response regulator [Candidatus Omnitrophota bacterium]MDD5080856.1 response regulator [Candidatus Omnitrophota bacterium]